MESDEDYYYFNLYGFLFQYLCLNEADKENLQNQFTLCYEDFGRIIIQDFCLNHKP